VPEAQPATSAGRSEASGRLAAWVAGALLAAPVVAFRYPPMGDLPMHEALVALLRRFGDTSFAPAGLYTLNVGPPNQLFHLVAAALALAVPTDLACKLVVAAAVAVTPVAGARLAAHLGTSTWSGLLVAPLALGFAFRWGLVGNVVALPILLASLPALDAYARDPGARRGAVACLLAVLLYMAHESAVVVYAVATGIFALRRPLAPARLAARLVPLGVCGLLVALNAWLAGRLGTPVRVGTFGPLWQRVPDVPGVLFGSGAPGAMLALFALYVLGVATFVAARLRASPSTELPSSGGWVERNRFALLAGVCALLYLVAPLTFGGEGAALPPTLIYQRFLPTACALFAVTFAPRAGTDPAVGLVPRAAAGAAVGGLLVTVLPGFADAARGFESLDRLIAQVAPASAVAQLDLTPRPPSRVAPVPGAAGRVLAERGGRLLFSFTSVPASVVVATPETQWNEPVLRMVSDPMAFRPAHDFGRFRYALVRLAASDPRAGAAVVLAMEPEGKLVDAAGEWLLFESNLPVVPLASPDVPLPAPPPASLRERLTGTRDR
jgi:hypothetical protein